MSDDPMNETTELPLRSFRESVRLVPRVDTVSGADSPKNEPGPLTPQELWMLRIGFSYALEALWRELGSLIEDDWLMNLFVALRTSQFRVKRNQPVCVRDRFAYFTQTVHLRRDEVEQLRSYIFDEARTE